MLRHWRRPTEACCRRRSHCCCTTTTTTTSVAVHCWAARAHGVWGRKRPPRSDYLVWTLRLARRGTVCSRGAPWLLRVVASRCICVACGGGWGVRLARQTEPPVCTVICENARRWRSTCATRLELANLVYLGMNESVARRREQRLSSSLHASRGASLSVVLPRKRTHTRVSAYTSGTWRRNMCLSLAWRAPRPTGARAPSQP